MNNVIIKLFQLFLIILNKIQYPEYYEYDEQYYDNEHECWE